MAAVNDARADAALRHLASWGLVGGPTEPIDLTGTTGLAMLAEQHRITGVVLAALDDGAATGVDDGAATGVSDALIDDLADRHLRLLQQSLMAEADLVFVARLFHDAGIEFRVLKGLATAHLDYPDPALRITSDVDLLVRRGQLDAATDVLRPHIDWEQSYPDRSAKWVQRYGKDRTLKLVDGSWIDLHQMLAHGWWGLKLDHDRLFDDGETFDVANTSLTGLAAGHRLLHALIHTGASPNTTIQSLRDVAQLAGRPDLSVPELVGLPQYRSICGLLAHGAERAQEMLEVRCVPSGFTSAVAPLGRERLALRANPGGRSHWTAILAVSVLRVPGFVAPLAFPDRQYLESLQRTRLTHLFREGGRSRIKRLSDCRSS